MNPRPTRAEALAGFARCIAEGMRISDSLTVEEAARRAYCAGGPSIPELERKIRALRAGRAPTHGIAA